MLCLTRSHASGPAAGGALRRACAWLLAGLLSWLGQAAPGHAAAAPARWSQLTEAAFQHLTLDNGLPYEIATSAVEDGAGFLWVGTHGGLARWDGYRFRIYKASRQTPGALADNFIKTLHRDTAGRLWVGTSAAGLARYDPLTDQFVTYTVGGTQGLSHVSVREIVDDGAGGLWVATDGGLDHVDGVTGLVQPAVPDLGLPSSAPNALLQDTRGGLWASEAAGLYHRPAGALRFAPVPLPAAPGETVRPKCLAQDQAGRVWVGTLQHGVYVVEHGAQGGRPVARRLDEIEPLRGKQVLMMLEARPGEMWLGMVDRSILVVGLDRGEVRRIRNVPTWRPSLPDAALHGLYRDRAGLVWVASDKGISRHNPQQTAISTRFGTVAPDSGERTSTDISWIQPMPQGRVWVGTHQWGVEILDSSGALVGALRPDPAHVDQALPRDVVLAMEPVPDGSVYIATRRGLYRASADGRRVQRVLLAGRDPVEATWALKRDGDTLWVGGQDDGLWRLDLRSGTAQPVLRDFGLGLSDQRITLLALSAPGRLWVGTRNGLNEVDTARLAVVSRYLPGPAAARGLSAGFVTALYQDARQRLWVGSFGGGIDVLPLAEPDGNTVHLGPDQGMPDPNVNAMLADAQGRVWASTDNGLALIDTATLAVRPLRRAEGVVFSTYWTGSAARTDEGELLFGGAGGMTIVRPGAVHTWDYRPPLLVTDLQLGGKSLPAARYLGAAAPAPLTVQADANSLAVEFAAADFSAPERNRYAYKLEGFDADWVETDAVRRLASYTNLPPGHYRLLLRGSNRDGAWSEQALSLPIRVQPAWHQTLWFRAGAVLAVIALLFSIVHARTRLLRARQGELERKVRERTAELEALSKALKEKSLVLERTSITDPLTGLHNRRFLTDHIDIDIAASLRRAQESRAAGGTPVDTDCVFFLVDVDHFKRVNDEHGHAVGDAVLVQFGRRLRSVLRESDYLVRWGGEEFLAVARETDRARAEELAERMRAAVADAPFQTDAGEPLAVSCSIGFACLPFVVARPHAFGWQEVVRLADMALLAAKRSGRNTWVGLHAADGVPVEGLAARVHAAPQRALRQGEITLASNRPVEQVAFALAGDAGDTAPWPFGSPQPQPEG
ncbi:MAG: two-component regulator propeller domain-containing protein [Burkholderiaceae bacterium]